MLKKLSKCIREYKLPSILAPIFIMLEVLMEVIIPTFMGKILDDGINGDGGNGNMKTILTVGARLVVFSLMSLLFGILAARFAAKSSTGFAKNLRHDMFYNLRTFSFSNIDRFSVSSLVTRMTTDVTNLQNAFQMLVRMGFRAPAMLIFSIAMSFVISPKLALVYVVIVPILGCGLFFIISKAHPVFTRVFKKYDILNRVVSENLRGIRVVKSFVREDFEKEKFNESSKEIYDDFVLAEKFLAFNAPLMRFSAYASLLLISWFGAKLIVNSGATEMTTGQLFTVFSYTMQILMNLMMLSMIFVMLTLSKASAQRITEVLDEKSDITNPENPIFEVKDGSIEFCNASFSYKGDKDKLCLSDINIRINSGETVGIIGGTGSAKSSLVRLIPRLYDTTIGQIKVGGNDVRDYDINTLRDAVAMVLQKNVLFSGTIKENLRWGNENATDEELVEACKLARADDFIKTFPDGYDTFIERGGSNVSGGQKQRICIARSLLKKPKILILDDSTSAVDTATDAKIRKGFSEFIPETTKIIIAQRISSVENADKIIVLDGGKIVDVGTHERLLETSRIYNEVYSSRMKGGKA